MPDDFKLEAIDDFDTIDDDLLANLLYDTENKANEKTNNNKVVLVNVTVESNQTAKSPFIPLQNNLQQFNNVTNQNQTSPFLPQMYFPNSTVTINYHFHK